jgi:subtilase family serine protease
VLQRTKLALLCATATILSAQALSAPAWATTPLVTAKVDDSVTVTLANERPVAAHTVTDLGALADSHALPHVILVMKRPASLQAALDKLISDQQNPKSASYHKWLAPSDLRAYGPAQADIDKTVSWLQSHGLKVNAVSPSGMSIDFGGTARQVATAFHTSLHSVSLNGETHIANMTDPAIPAALAPAVHGATLSNFFPKPNNVKAHPNFTVPFPPGYFFAVGPDDFATIYNVKPLWTGNNPFGYKATGEGVTIAVVEQTDILPGDWNTFRTNFKLTGFKKGSLKLTHPGFCGDPGFTGDEVEAAIDADWSSAVAPNATIIEASCPSSDTNFGVEQTLQNLVELGTTASALSISYGGSEVSNGLTFLTGWSNLVEEGAAEGLSIMISAGDSGSSSSESVTTTGLAVNGLSSNPYNTTVGGTDFYDTALGKIGTYWNVNNTNTLQSAKSYIPEIPWNNSCASSVIVKYLGFASAQALCNSTQTAFFVQNDIGGSGGQSLYYSKPDWQNIGVPGVPADGVRDQPDVSLFAANGIWSHFYVICMSDPNEGGSACDYSNADDVLGNAYGGTSVAAPAFAGIIALVVQGNGFKIGNPAPLLYQLAKTQFNNPLLLKNCNSTLGKAISSACVFNNITAGNNAEACVKGTPDCHTAGSAPLGVGVLTASTKAPFVNAFPAGPGYSLATGLGTVNATNLFINMQLDN